jgi:hypothetical protein
MQSTEELTGMMISAYVLAYLSLVRVPRTRKQEHEGQPSKRYTEGKQSSSF